MVVFSSKVDIAKFVHAWLQSPGRALVPRNAQRLKIKKIATSAYYIRARGYFVSYPKLPPDQQARRGVRRLYDGIFRRTFTGS